MQSGEHSIAADDPVPANVPELDLGKVGAGVTLLVGGLLLLTEGRRLL